MNSFSFRHTREGIRYRGEFRLAHWAGYKTVMDGGGEPILFAHPADAAIAAANELVQALNGNPTFWSGSSSTEARDAAERLFARKDNGGEKEKS